MTNDGALEYSHQGEIIFGYLARVRDNYKKRYFFLRENRQYVHSTNFRKVPHFILFLV